jgi:recombination protein RecA
MSTKRRKLDAVVARLQLEHGPKAIRRASPGEKTPTVRRIPTSFAELDAELGGGLPRGRVTEITGVATSGKVTLAAKVIASAQREREALAAWVDLNRNCDADYLHRCGVSLDRLLVVRPGGIVDALALILQLVETGAVSVLVLDLTAAAGDRAEDEARVPAEAFARLVTVTAQMPTAVLCLTEPGAKRPALAHAAAVRLALRRERWLTRGKDVRGYEGQVEVVKNRLGRAGAIIPLRITINGTVRGEGLW